MKANIAGCEPENIFLSDVSAVQLNLQNNIDGKICKFIPTVSSLVLAYNEARVSSEVNLIFQNELGLLT